MAPAQCGEWSAVEPSDDGVAAVPTFFIDDPEYWRKRAEEARTIAERMTDSHTKALVLGVAESYEKIAKWAGESAGEPSSNVQ